MGAKHTYRDTKSDIVAIKNSKGHIYTVGQRGTYNETGEPIYISQIREPVQKTITEYRLRIADATNKIFLTLDIEYVEEFLTFK